VQKGERVGSTPQTMTVMTTSTMPVLEKTSNSERVDGVLAQRLVAGAGLTYLVRWKDSPMRKDSWVPASTLEGSEALLTWGRCLQVLWELRCVLLRAVLRCWPHLLVAERPCAVCNRCFEDGRGADSDQPGIMWGSGVADAVEVKQASSLEGVSESAACMSVLGINAPS
jgi:hypothetical protein